MFTICISYRTQSRATKCKGRCFCVAKEPVRQKPAQISGVRTRVSNGYWNYLSSRRLFTDNLAKKLNIKQLDDWNNVTATQFRKHGGASLLTFYNGSLHQLLQHVYPSHEWNVTARRKVSKGYWNDVSKQRKFMDEIGKKLDIKHLDDWNAVTNAQVVERGGGTLLTYHNGSLYKLLQFVYPEHKWNALNRVLKPRGFWKDKANQRNFFQQVAEKLGIKFKSDWMFVSNKELLKHGGSRILQKFHSLPSALHNAYEEQFEDNSKPYVSRSQQQLLKTVMQLFEGINVEVNAKYPDFRYTQTTNRTFEADILIPSLSLVFEYQGGHHYFPTWYNDTGLNITSQRDKEKSDILQQLGFTLVHVPYWWDKSKESLAGTITKVRPDLLPATPQRSPFIDYSIPEDTTNHKRFMISRHYTSEDPTDWWMSEKYDGIRGYWDGSQLLSRNANIMALPKHITDTFPDIILDGEIWFGRGTLLESMKVAHRAQNIKWQDFRFMVFDAPKHGGVLEERMEYLRNSIPSDHPFIKVVPLVRCQSKSHLDEFFAQTMSLSGEGVILRAPRSLYIEDRSNSFLKYKPHFDEEVLVLDKAASKEYWLLKVDTWNCVTRSNIKFSCSAMSSINSQIQSGMIVTIKHSGFFRDRKPRKPRICAIRPDVTVDQFWADR